jgi:hypothetical protein
MATVFPAPTSPVMTPRADSWIQKLIRATASAWPSRVKSWWAGMLLVNGVWVNPKCLTHGARLMTGPKIVVVTVGNGRVVVDDGVAIAIDQAAALAATMELIALALGGDSGAPA